MKTVCWFLNMFLLFTIIGCSNTAYIQGQVKRISGNQMPSPDEPANQHKGFETQIFFVEPFKPAGLQLDKQGVFYQLPSTLIKKVQTDKNGFYSLKLKPGKYSVFIEKSPNTYFSNITDAQGYVNTWEIVKGRKYIINLLANWDSRY